MPSERYDPVMTLGRELYERWLWTDETSPDDLWDWLGEGDRFRWEQLAKELINA